ncbi:Abi family protein [Fusobacterium pseudoperiodonticum]|uniref:Abi family protein n=1 Tax=Fusobacterium pseudoperiodonticum TaxID=2663009 RepID=UPI0030CC41B5
MNDIEKIAINTRSNNVKKPTTIEEQIKLLESREVVIEDENFAKKFLRIYNYYFVTGYLHPYKTSDDKYKNISFNGIATQIKFDMRLREICMYALDIIEKGLKTIIAYEFSHNYENGNIAYAYSLYFSNNEDKHTRLMGHYNVSLNNNKELPYVKHNMKTYGILPTWVAIELFTLGNIEKFFSMLDTNTKKKIEDIIGFPKNKIQNWIENLRIFRNMVAHNQRLYNFSILSMPKKAKEYNKQTGKIFDYVIVMKYLFLDNEDWNTYVLPRLEYIFDDFKDNIDLKCIGFPNDWKNILTK